MAPAMFCASQIFNDKQNGSPFPLVELSNCHYKLIITTDLNSKNWFNLLNFFFEMRQSLLLIE